jgi:hypothetical protein
MRLKQLKILQTTPSVNKKTEQSSSKKISAISVDWEKKRKKRKTGQNKQRRRRRQLVTELDRIRTMQSWDMNA